MLYMYIHGRYSLELERASIKKEARLPLFTKKQLKRRPVQLSSDMNLVTDESTRTVISF